MKAKRNIRKKALLLFSALLLLTMGMVVTACSSEEEEYSEERESLAEFFKKSFPQEKDGEGTNVTDVPFVGFNEQGSVCKVINSYDELKSSYRGNETLPEVDFSKYSLVVGRAWLNVGYKFKNLTVTNEDGNSVVTLHFTVLHDTAVALVTYYYYWALCPKFTPKTIVTKIGGADYMLPVSDVDEKIKSFFEIELPTTNRSTGFFTSEKLNADVAYVINDESELSGLYTGTLIIPSIDFDRFTLVVGKARMPVSFYYVTKQDISVFGSSAIVNLYASLMSDSGYYTALSTLYFWGIYPKFHVEHITVNKIEDGIKIEDIDKKK